jgi:glucosamine 6-phosphate synthetase-like amidotransferase/phosphosugar isomerase protein
MCNIAGYVGKRDALPILKEMIRKQEGIDSGFYTGVAIHDGKELNFRKVQGCLETLIESTDVDSLIGKVGIIHSRTPSGGDYNWAHPFYTKREGKVKFCYVANGNRGVFADRMEYYREIANYLETNGFEIPGKIKDDGYYITLESGDAVHISDVMCQLIYKYKSEGCNTVDAMTKAFTYMPYEIVGLSLEEESSDRIYFSRINKPMFVGFDKDGAYAATTPAAFPESVKEYKLLPALSSGVIYADKVETFKYYAFEKNVRGFNKRTIENTKKLILEMLSENESCYDDFERRVLSLKAKEEIIQEAPLVYESLYELLKEGKIKQKETERTWDGQTAPFKLYTKAKN